MKAETKAKIKCKLSRAWKTIKALAGPVAVAGTICAAWEGYSNSRRNERDLKETNKILDCVNVGSYRACKDLEERVAALEEKQNKLLTEAMEVTEGKEDEVA